MHVFILHHIAHIDILLSHFNCTIFSRLRILQRKRQSRRSHSLIQTQSFTQHQISMRNARTDIVDQFGDSSIEMRILLLIILSNRLNRMIDVSYVCASEGKPIFDKLRQGD